MQEMLDRRIELRGTIREMTRELKNLEQALLDDAISEGLTEFIRLDYAKLTRHWR